MLNRQGRQQQRPESPTVTPPGMRVNTRYVNPIKGTPPPPKKTKKKNSSGVVYTLHFRHTRWHRLCTGIRQNQLLHKIGQSSLISKLSEHRNIHIHTFTCLVSEWSVVTWNRMRLSLHSCIYYSQSTWSSRKRFRSLLMCPLSAECCYLPLLILRRRCKPRSASNYERKSSLNTVHHK